MKSRPKARKLIYRKYLIVYEVREADRHVEILPPRRSHQIAHVRSTAASLVVWSAEPKATRHVIGILFYSVDD